MNTCEEHLKSNYLLLTMQMQNICKVHYDDHCSAPGLYKGEDENALDLILFKEICNDYECRYTNKDRYRLCCNIRDKRMNHMFRTRDEQYPWKLLPYAEKSIVNRKHIFVYHT